MTQPHRNSWLIKCLDSELSTAPTNLVFSYVWNPPIDDKDTIVACYAIEFHGTEWQLLARDKGDHVELTISQDIDGIEFFGNEVVDGKIKNVLIMRSKETP